MEDAARHGNPQLSASLPEGAHGFAPVETVRLADCMLVAQALEVGFVGRRSSRVRGRWSANHPIDGAPPLHAGQVEAAP